MWAESRNKTAWVSRVYVRERWCVDSHENAFKRTQLPSFDIRSYLVNISCSFQSAVWRAGACLACPLWKVHRQRKPLAECCHNISIRQIYGYSFAEEWPRVACCTFSSPLLSCPACSRSLALCGDVLHSQRELRWDTGGFFDSPPCSVFNPWAEKCNLGQGRWTQWAADWNLLAVHSRLN